MPSTTELGAIAAPTPAVHLADGDDKDGASMGSVPGNMSIISLIYMCEV